MLPGIQRTVAAYLAAWSAKGTVVAYTEVLTLAFDVLVNTALQLSWPKSDVQRYAEVFEVWNQGFTPAADWDKPDSKFVQGMKAREALKARFRASLKDPKGLAPGSLPEALVQAYGADSDVCTDNLIMVIFAGFETTTSLVVGLLNRLLANPAVLKQVVAEQKAVLAQHPSLTLEALEAMKVTQAAISETLRMGQIVANVPRLATLPIQTPAGLKVASGCPFSTCWGAMSVRDPAVKGSVDRFSPERWLDPKNRDSLSAYQRPFGSGTHSCVGFRVARALAAAVAREVAVQYTLSGQPTSEFDDFPTGHRPVNGLPITLIKAPAHCRA